MLLSGAAMLAARVDSIPTRGCTHPSPIGSVQRTSQRALKMLLCKIFRRVFGVQSKRLSIGYLLVWVSNDGQEACASALSSLNGRQDRRPRRMGSPSAHQSGWLDWIMPSRIWRLAFFF